MSEFELKNERIKREYFAYCRGAKGFAESTINKYAQCIYKWQECFGNDDFAYFDKHKCDIFKEYLKKNAEKNDTSLINQYHILRHVKKFFTWLTDQKGYEKIHKTDAEYLKLSRKETNIALEKREKEILSLNEIKHLVQSIPQKTEIDMRDKALITFLALTGMRISAVTSLSMQSFDKYSLMIKQSPTQGTKTKNTKRILSTLFPIWDDGEKIFLDWYEFLEKRGFGLQKPIFPANKKFSLSKISDEFWLSSNPARTMIQERCKRANMPYYNPHSFRHAVVAYMSEMGLTEADKRAISLTLGHEHIGTTFGSYGYGSLTPKEAVKRVRAMKNISKEKLNLSISDEDLGKAIRDILTGNQI